MSKITHPSHSVNSDKAYFSVHDAAKLLAISKRGLYRLTKQGKVKSMRVGGSVRIPRDVIFPQDNKNETA